MKPNNEMSPTEYINFRIRVKLERWNDGSRKDLIESVKDLLSCSRSTIGFDGTATVMKITQLYRRR